MRTVRRGEIIPFVVLFAYRERVKIFGRAAKIFYIKTLPIAACRFVHDRQNRRLMMAVSRRERTGAFSREFDDLFSEMENRFNALLEGFETTPLLPAPAVRGRVAAGLRGEFQVDVREKEDEIIIEADLPGVEKEDVTIRLLDPRTLEIS
ncbi:MAG: hypothetical protein LUQ13_02965, partial [Methanomicrobiales archaeon]|nr:hypothetical protein [Methanomicrobiales archaeon]